MQSWLAQIVDYLLTQSWQIAILTAMVAAASFALRNRSAHIRYLLWLIVLAKCLIPPLCSVPLAVLPEGEPLASAAMPLFSETSGPEFGAEPSPEAGEDETKPLLAEQASVPESAGPPGWALCGWPGHWY
jgi:hypothetical protein